MILWLLLVIINKTWWKKTLTTLQTLKRFPIFNTKQTETKKKKKKKEKKKRKVVTFLNSQTSLTENNYRTFWLHCQSCRINLVTIYGGPIFEILLESAALQFKLWKSSSDILEWFCAKVNLISIDVQFIEN